MKKLTKKYQIWCQESSNEEFTLKEYDTLEEAILSNKNGLAWYLTEQVQFTITNNPENGK